MRGLRQLFRKNASDLLRHGHRAIAGTPAQERVRVLRPFACIGLIENPTVSAGHLPG
ncbi:hypothetical protein THIOKS11320073 [Thiocapsa sp. KS1]|nr:hypothetical protein THIOKS11320073 [Thiocapsa sp. KS1]